MVQLPGLIDPHVHMREPGATHKEDWDSGTAAALAGGFTMVLAMPNTKPPVVEEKTLAIALKRAHQKARCDYALFLGACAENVDSIASLAGQVAGLKMYLNQTFGLLLVDDHLVRMRHFANWHPNSPIVVHAERDAMGAIILLAAIYNRSVHICHVSRRDEILLIRAAKEKGYKITCEVAPHHLFLCEDDIPRLPGGRSEVRPPLGTAIDQRALWENLDVIDCFASDHAPHTAAEKDENHPPPGFPGLETTLPLLLTAVSEGRLALEELVSRCYTNPRRIFNLPAQPETYVEVDMDSRWEIRAADMKSRCGWTPFEGMRVNGKVSRVVLRGREAFRKGEVFALPGTGRNVKEA